MTTDVNHIPTNVEAGPDVVRLSDVSKRFVVRKDNSIKERIVTLGRAGRQHRDEFWALSQVNFSIQAGTTVGLIGHNGSGKSTLLKVIGGIIQPTSGTVEHRGRIAALLELGAGFHPDLTGRENVFLNASILGLSREETEKQFDAIVAFSGIGDFIETQVKFYSSGMYVRLAFAVAVHTDPDILLVDEVLAVGDEAFQRKCLDKIRSFQNEGRTIVLVTHSLGQVTELCDRAVLLDHGQVMIDGDPREAVSMFRDLLEEDRIEELPEAERDVERVGVLESTTTQVVGKAPGTEVSPGDDLLVRVAFTEPADLRRWICSIQIDNALGQVVYGTNTLMLGDRVSTDAPTTAVEFLLRDVSFGAGKFFVNTSIIDRETRKHVQDTPQACSFDVPYYPLASGMVHIQPDVSLVTG
jgi:ABC-2 type transport system ATP-binding protein